MKEIKCINFYMEENIKGATVPDMHYSLNSADTLRASLSNYHYFYFHDKKLGFYTISQRTI